MPRVIDSSTLALNKVNANTKLYMRMWSRNLTTLFSLLVKKTSNFCGVARRLSNKTLPFSQHRENYGLLLDFVLYSTFSHYKIHTLCPFFRNLIMSRLMRFHFQTIIMHHYYEKVVHVLLLVVRCIVLDIDDYFGLMAFQMAWPILYAFLAHHSFCRRLRRSCADSKVFWLNSVGALICGTRFSKESVCLSFC